MTRHRRRPRSRSAPSRPHSGDGVPPANAEESATRRIQRGYGAWARTYDWFARATASVGGVRSGCVRALDLDPGDTVVEFGCGPGVNVPALRAAVGPTGRVVGVDVTGAMLDRARRLADRRGWENVEFVRGDATDPPIGAADAVLATFVTSLFPDPYAVVSDWCTLADSVAVAAFAPRGSRPANAALSAFARLNGRLFDLEAGDPLGQLDARTAAARRSLADNAETVTEERYLFGTITVCAGHGRAGDRNE
ncbi:methyltransferase domain-containing protein [Halorubrum sp. AD140]|uniref:class I SAM-dependent methyltransferase n=1 Tax=Halorubrum sp. AD140 TaxID=3050073 RepID=UPI002ACC3F25|nr:methyltransferase domain-containing protein [Halorubrum sp. AD140]MDZ5810841.1 methyltransferase domain-containing protein [Halorubrum sp. AD140]